MSLSSSPTVLNGGRAELSRERIVASSHDRRAFGPPPPTLPDREYEAWASAKDE